VRDVKQTIRTIAARACAAVSLCAALLFALHATAGVARAQDKAAEEQEKILKETGTRPPVMNTVPLEDLARKGKELFDAGRLGADTRIDVSATAGRNDDGTLKPDSLVLTWTTASDETVASFVQQFFSALSQSKLLGALEGAKELSLRLKVDEANAHFSVAAVMPSAGRARQYADGYGALLRIATLKKQGTNEGELYKSVGFASDDKLFTFTFEMPKERLAGIISEMLAKKAERARSES
jgi:hypothetical protein